MEGGGSVFGAAGGGEGGAAAGSAPPPQAPAAPAHPLDALQFELDNIFVAAGDGELAKVQAFVAGGVSVNSRDEYGYTPLCVWWRCPRAAALVAFPQGGVLCFSHLPRRTPPSIVSASPHRPSPPPPLPPRRLPTPPPPSRARRRAPLQPRGLQLRLRGGGAVAAGAGRHAGHH